MTPTSILVPIDFSPGSERALDYACNLSARLGATVHLINALGGSLPELSGALSGAMVETMMNGRRTELTRLAAARRPAATFDKLIVKNNDPRDAILEATGETGADLIVMGSHGRRGVSRWVLGSVAEDVLRRAPCPVLVVPGTKDR
jgi:nucleotide-binding universal stress UspA family protein